MSILIRTFLIDYIDVLFFTGDKRVTAIINDGSANNDHQQTNIDNKLLMYLQIPIAVVVFGLIFLLWKCIAKRSSLSNPPVYYEEEMKLNNNKM